MTLKEAAKQARALADALTAGETGKCMAGGTCGPVADFACPACVARWHVSRAAERFESMFHRAKREASNG